MACSPECFQEYMSRIEKSRNIIMQKNLETNNIETDNISTTQIRKRKTSGSKIVSENNIIEN